MDCRQEKNATINCQCQFPLIAIKNQLTFSKLKANDQKQKDNTGKCIKKSLRKKKSYQQKIPNKISSTLLSNKTQHNPILKKDQPLNKQYRSSVPVNFQYSQPNYLNQSYQEQRKIFYSTKNKISKGNASQPKRIFFQNKNIQNVNINIQFDNKENIKNYQSTNASNIRFFQKQSLLSQFTDSNIPTKKVNFVFKNKNLVSENVYKHKNPIEIKEIKKNKSFKLLNVMNQSSKRPVSLGKLSQLITRKKTLQELVTKQDVQSVLGQQQNSQQFSQVLMSCRQIIQERSLQVFELTNFNLVTQNDRQN